MSTPGLLIKQPWSLHVDEIYSIAIPQLTTAERDNLATPPNGMVIFNSTLGQFQFRESSGWTAIRLASVQIATADVAANAITANAVLVDGSGASQSTLEAPVGPTGSVTISTNGGVVVLIFKAGIKNTGAGTHLSTYRIRKDSSTGTILDTLNIVTQSGDQFAVVLVARDDTPAASQTYVFTHIMDAGADFVDTKDIKMMAVNLKK